ncbi:XRE family transcriptional regulator [Zavarzinia compransoris]|uniref:Transcriptional regulator n=1 Tax=Zavarzinia compransoris TaxID=1264899 RepID=A0A317ECZ2_9PROT|nr:helix-turn-helix transcriptional regulator [Zavarzinia compransoris]PWR24010.1 transcriptional regulator [Zavarzinia compransoris]TDP48270.1 phage repressor protein C with HTH and peptisase S24 domain [Zavarzinia compransoris]
MHNRLGEWRRHAGLTQDQLAERAGTVRSQIVKLERGERRLTVDWMLRLAKHLGCEPGDLLPEAPLPAAAGLQAPAPQPWAEAAPLRDLPVCGAARGGANALFVDQGQALEYTFRPAQLAGVANAFAVYAVGDSMEPKFRAGDLLFLNPNLPPVRGCFVVVELGDDEAYVKQFVRQSNDELTLREFNPEPRDLPAIPTRRVKAIHRVVGSWEGQ